MDKRIIPQILVILIIPMCFDTNGQPFNGYKWETLNCTGEPVARHEAVFIESKGKFYLMGDAESRKYRSLIPKPILGKTEHPPIELHHFKGFSYNSDKMKPYIASGSGEMGRKPELTSIEYFSKSLL